MYTVGGLFSGIGGIELGFEQAGFEIAWSNEVDKYCIETYKKNHKHKIYSESITDLDFKKIKPRRCISWWFSMSGFFCCRL